MRAGDQTNWKADQGGAADLNRVLLSVGAFFLSTAFQCASIRHDSFTKHKRDAILLPEVFLAFGDCLRPEAQT